MVTTRCHGRYFGGRNACDCPECRERERVKGDYIGANEHVARLENRGAPEEAIEAAKQRRDVAGDRWEAWEAGDG